VPGWHEQFCADVPTPQGRAGGRGPLKACPKHTGAPGGAPPIVPQVPIIRARGEGEQRATFFELLFDLVYVFAVTQLSHHLLEHLSWSGAAQTMFMLVALHWAWNYTTWITNWFDPRHGAGSTRARVRDGREPADGDRDPGGVWR
jgi:hypothetical protein